MLDMPKVLYVLPLLDEGEKGETLYDAYAKPGQAAVVDETVEVGIYQFVRTAKVRNETVVDESEEPTPEITAPPTKIKTLFTFHKSGMETHAITVFKENGDPATADEIDALLLRLNADPNYAQQDDCG